MAASITITTVAYRATYKILLSSEPSEPTIFTAVQKYIITNNGYITIITLAYAQTGSILKGCKSTQIWVTMNGLGMIVRMLLIIYNYKDNFYGLNLTYIYLTIN